MSKATRGPRPSSSSTEDRKAIEQRARDAAAPFAPAKKGQWPFVPQESGDLEESGNSQPDSSDKRRGH